MKRHIKKNEEVVVIAGAYKGQKGKVLSLLVEKQRVRIEGIGVRSIRLPKSQQNPQGGTLEQATSIHWSNVIASTKYELKKERKQK